MPPFFPFSSSSSQSHLSSFPTLFLPSPPSFTFEPSHLLCLFLSLLFPFSFYPQKSCVCLIIGRRDLFFFLASSVMNSWRQIKDKPCGFLTAQKGGAAGRHPSCLVIGMWKRYQAHGSLCVCSCTCVLQANSRLKQIEKEYTQKLAKSSQVSMGQRHKTKQNPKQRAETRPTQQNLCTSELNQILVSFSWIRIIF